MGTMTAGREGDFGTGGRRHSWNCHRAIPAAGWDAQLLARGGSWSQCPGPSPAHCGCWPGGDTDPRGEVTTRSSQQLPVTASPGMALHAAESPPRPKSPFLGGPRAGAQPPHQSRETKGAGDQLQPGNVPCPRPRSQGSGFPVPRQPEPGTAFQAQAFLHPAGLGARGGGRQGGPCLPRAQAGGRRQAGEKGKKVKHRWERGGGRTPRASMGARGRHPLEHRSEPGGMHPPKASLGAGGCTLTAGPHPRGRPGLCPRWWHCRRAQGVRDATPGQQGREPLPAHSRLPAGRRAAGMHPASAPTSVDGSGCREIGSPKQSCSRRDGGAPWHHHRISTHSE